MEGREAREEEHDTPERPDRVDEAETLQGGRGEFGRGGMRRGGGQSVGVGGGSGGEARRCILSSGVRCRGLHSRVAAAAWLDGPRL